MKNAVLAVFSDIHLGHKSNDTLSILKMLDHEIFTKKLLEKIDILIFAGDTFDRLLQLDYPYLPELDSWFAKLLRYCESQDVIFFVLEGTPSHDRGQPERFKTIYDIIESKAQFEYINELKIKYVEKFDMTILFIPDEWRVDNAQTLDEVKALMKHRGLEQIDIAVMHGQFEYQIPVKGKGIPIHDANEYEQLVRNAIFIGHVHNHSRSGKIVAQGSFDRLRHGEEEAKGYIFAEIKNGQTKIHFIENKAARIYKTIQLFGLDVNTSLSKIDKAIYKQPVDMCLRIEAEPTHPLFANFHQLEKRYPTVTFSKLPKNQASDDNTDVLIENEFNKWVSISITKDNVTKLVIDRISTEDFSDAERSFMFTQLQEAL